MNVLFTCVVGYGHFHPLVPLALAMQSAGHRVAFATDPGFCDHVRTVGFEAHPAGLNQREAMARFVVTVPGWPDIPAQDRMPHMYPGLFGRVRVPPMLDDLGRLVVDWRPDLIIHDSGEMAGAIAAEAAGVAHAEHSFGILRPAQLRHLATETLAPISDGLGVRNPGVGGVAGELYLDICPPGIQQPEIAEVAHVQRLRPMGFDAAPDAPLPAWIEALPQRPTVYLTMGTVFNDAADVFRMVLEGLRREAITVIVTVGRDADPAVLGPQPDNVHVERYIPQSALLPHCDLLISHTGSGALLGAVNAGVPMLALPQGADQFMNAEQVVQSGLGLRLMPSDLSPTTVRAEVRRLLGERQFADVARALQSSIEGMPAPAAVVPVLEALVK